MKTKQQILESLKSKNLYLWVDDNKYTLYHPPTDKNITLQYASDDAETLQYIKNNLPLITDKTFLPNSGEYLQNPLGLTYNTYKKYTPKHNKINDLSLWVEFLNRLFPIQSERDYVIKFLAHIFQKPEERPSFGLLLTSDTGTGKGFLFSEILTPLLMKQTSQDCSYQTFLHQFSTSLNGTLLCMLDDPKSDHNATMTKLKSRLSESVIKIEEKYCKPRMQPVFTRILLASNERAPLKIESNERRWFAPKYIKHKVDRAETQMFISKLASSLDLDSIYNWFMQVDLSGFNHKNPMITDTLNQMIGCSVDEWEIIVENFLESKEVFKWVDLEGLLPFGFHTQTVKSKIVEMGYQSKRFTINKNKVSAWFKTNLTKEEVIEQLSVPF